MLFIFFFIDETTFPRSIEQREITMQERKGSIDKVEGKNPRQKTTQRTGGKQTGSKWKKYRMKKRGMRERERTVKGRKLNEECS